jgi:hypothetical protein
VDAGDQILLQNHLARPLTFQDLHFQQENHAYQLLLPILEADLDHTPVM